MLRFQAQQTLQYENKSNEEIDKRCDEVRRIIIVLLVDGQLCCDT